MTKEELEELKEQIELVNLEVGALEEAERYFGTNDSPNFSKTLPATRDFMAARLKYLKKKLGKLRKKHQAWLEYEEWDQRTRP